MGYVDSDGFVFITGRIKRIFIVRKDGVSVKVFPDQTEASINKSTYVNTCCVVPVPDDKQVNKVIAWVVKNEDVSDETAQNEILQLCRDLLPSQFVPDEVFFINHLPLTAVGKIDYRALEKRAEEMKDK